MKRYLFSFVFALLIVPMYAQSQDNQVEQNALVQKLDSLEHELTYLRCLYELEACASNISLKADKIDLMQFKLNYYKDHDSLDRSLKKTGRKLCEKYEESYQLDEEISENIIEKVNSIMDDGHFTTKESMKLLAKIIELRLAIRDQRRSLNILKEILK